MRYASLIPTLANLATYVYTGAKVVFYKLSHISVLLCQNLNPCFLTFWSTEVDPYSLFKFLIFNYSSLFALLFYSMLAYVNKPFMFAYFT